MTKKLNRLHGFIGDLMGDMLCYLSDVIQLSDYAVGKLLPTIPSFTIQLLQ